MSDSTAIDTVNGLDFEEIEAAVMETTRGRWFLTEFARRARAADTKILLGAIRRLEDQLLAMPVATPANPDIDRLVRNAEEEMQRLSGPATVPAEDIVAVSDKPANARLLAARLTSITGNLKNALGHPAEEIAEIIAPEIRKLDACAAGQDELANALSRTAQMVRRIRSSQSIDHDGEAQTADRQLAAPEPVENPEPARISIAKKPPAFVPSDDDIFAEDSPVEKPQNNSKLPSIGSDTLNFSNIEVPPLPSSTDQDNDDSPQPTTTESEPVASEATPDRVISVIRPRQQPTASKNSPTAMRGQVDLKLPVAANQPATPATAAPNDSNSKKRIIVIRRPADETANIPLAGSDNDSPADGPSAA